MKEERLLTVLISPHVSEKSVVLGEANKQFVFKVRKDATKPEIKAAVEKIFEVKVDGVRVLNKMGKRKGRMGKTPGRRASVKKAYVALKEGYNIDFMGGAAPSKS